MKFDRESFSPHCRQMSTRNPGRQLDNTRIGSNCLGGTRYLFTLKYHALRIGGVLQVRGGAMPRLMLCFLQMCSLFHRARVEGSVKQ